jgi:hypothetical protein
MPFRRSFLSAILTGFLALAGARAATVDEPTMGQPASIPPGKTQLIALRPDGGTTLSAALAGIAQWRIAPGAVIVLKLADGTYRQAGTLHIEHPDGTRIQIVGNADAPDKVRLVWPSHTDGIDVRGGQVLGRLDGVTLFREIPGGNDNGANDNAVGLLAENSGVLLAGPAVVVDGFYYGAQARYGGVMRLHGVTVRHAGDAGFFAYNGGHIDAQQARAEDVSDSKLGLGSGFVAEYGGTIDATGAQSMRNALAGFSALSAGAIVADGATASENRRYGFYAITNGSIVAHHPKLLKNGIKPSQAEQGGSISGMEP